MMRGGLTVELRGPGIGPLSLILKFFLFILLQVLSVGIVGVLDVSGALPPTVRVLVDRERSQFEINGYDVVVKDVVNRTTLARANGRAHVHFNCALDGRIWIKGIHQESVLAGNRYRQFKGPLLIESLGGFLRIGTHQYRDELYLYSFNGDCMVVNHVDLEKYVAGLLNSEMSSKWNLETLKAQAVAARTYAVFQMREASGVGYPRLHSPFDLDSTVKDQVYEGAHQERYKALQAVFQTAGEILVYNGHPIKAFYHSTCGGQTESPVRVWGFRAPYMKSVPCGFCDRSPRYSWSMAMPLVEVERRLRNIGLWRVGTLEGVRVAERDGAGRAISVDLMNLVKGGRQVGAKRISAIRLRDALGADHLRSTSFDLSLDDGLVNFKGRGSGHGVGLCQWGAKTMGEKGYAYRTILTKYYPLAQLTKVY